jgi:hypothetical protein
MRLAEEGADKAQDPELALYRDRTVGLLRKYLRMSVELGHLPSLLGREFFRTHVTNYGTNTFEDVVIFVHDVERCLEKMHRRHQTVIARLFFQQYTNEETAAMMGCPLSTFERWRTEALNTLSGIFLERKMLERLAIPSYEPLEEEEQEILPPKKPVKGVRDIQAVAVFA